MREALSHWTQYGFATDVFDKYRDAVKRSNRDSLRVLSCVTIAACIATIVFGYVTDQNKSGLYYCLFELVAGIIGAVISFREKSSRTVLLLSGYLLCFSIHLLAIYGAVALKTDAFWIGTQIAVGCYVFDYAWRVGLLQLLSYAGLYFAWNASPDVAVDGTRLLFSGLFLLVSLVTFYTLNRTRASLILGKEETRQASETDLLTGLTVRIAAQQEIEEHLKTDDHGVMMLLDLDRFKSVNDRLGHQMGDKVLVDVAKDLKLMFRNTDVLSRLGGDEFIIYMKAVPEEAWVRRRADEVVRTIRRWVTDGTTNVQISASVGVVMTNGMERNYEDLYRAADIAMYFSKAQGGNKAVFYSKDLVNQVRGSVTTREEDGDGNAKTLAEHNGVDDSLR